MDHLLSKEKKRNRSKELYYCLVVKKATNISGGDALWGNTRSHPEHDG